jgi:dCTP deaminase
MADTSEATHPEPVDGDRAQGILPAEAIRRLVENRQIIPGGDLAVDQIQPASLDLRLGRIAYRVRASFLPGPERVVRERLDFLGLHQIDLTQGAVLETGCVYIVPLLEELRLPAHIAADANPKSSTGRLDIFTRVLADRARAFDKIEAGYQGPLYLEISPRTFPILVRTGSRLAQVRFRRGKALLSDQETLDLHRVERLVDTDTPNIGGGIAVSVDLAGKVGLVGYRAKRHTAVVDVDKRAAYDVMDFWEAIETRRGGSLILDPNEFYILASKEAVHVPPTYAAEMVPFDPLVGEFRVHYAGFFDPGFGHVSAGGHGSRAVLEVRSRDVPFIIEDGQIVGRLVYERLTERPQALYGTDIGSHYQAQGLKLSKHFHLPTH